VRPSTTAHARSSRSSGTARASRLASRPEAPPHAAQPAAFGGPIDVFVRPNGDTFGGSRLVIAATDGGRTLVDATTEIEYPRVSPDWSSIAYADAGSIYVVDVSSGESSEVADGRMAAWVDDDTLLVAPE
jgi:hypothetical protein